MKVELSLEERQPPGDTAVKYLKSLLLQLRKPPGEKGMATIVPGPAAIIRLFTSIVLSDK